MNVTVARLTLRALLGRRRALLLFALPALLVLLAGVVRWVSGPHPGLAAPVLGDVGLGTIVPLLALIAGTGAIAPEIDDGSIVYLLSKPLNRFTIVVSKYAVAVGTVLTFAALPTLAAGLILAGTQGRLAYAYAGAAAVASLAYCALFLLLGVVSRNAVVIGLLYALIWESLVGGLVPGARALSVQQWATAVGERISVARDWPVQSAVSLTTGVTLLAVVAVGATALAGWRLRSLRLTSDE
jgi:ABC-2 type transport system permease protein